MTAPAVGPRPVARLELARVLQSRRGCMTPLVTIREQLEWDVPKVRRVVRDMERAGLVQGVDADFIELTKLGREWLREQERSDA